MQPYHGGDRDLLARLRDLDNLDKHRSPPVLAAIGEIPAFDVEGIAITSYQAKPGSPVKHEAEIMRFVVNPGAEVNMNFAVGTDVAFGEGFPGYGLPVLPLLRSIRNFIVARIVPTLEPFL